MHLKKSNLRSMWKNVAAVQMESTEVYFSSFLSGVYNCHSSKSKGKETGKTHLTAHCSDTLSTEYKNLTTALCRL